MTVEIISLDGYQIKKVKGRWGTTHYEPANQTGDYQSPGKITGDSPEDVVKKLKETAK